MSNLSPLGRFIGWADRHSFISVRAFTLYITLLMTWEAFQWAGQYAFTAKLDGIGIAAVIAAVTAPISALQGFIFKFYVENRQ